MTVLSEVIRRNIGVPAAAYRNTKSIPMPMLQIKVHLTVFETAYLSFRPTKRPVSASPANAKPSVK